MLQVDDSDFTPDHIEFLKEWAENLDISIEVLLARIILGTKRRRSDSLVRLVDLDSVYVRGSQVSQWPLVVQSRIPKFDEFSFSRGNRELRTVRVGQAGIFPGQLVDNIVKGGSEVMSAKRTRA